MALSNDQWKNIIETCSGLSAGAISTVLLYPLDLVKTHYQIHEYTSRPYRNIGHALTSIVQEQQYRGLFRGMSPALYGSTVAWGLYMYLYHHAKSRYARYAEDGTIKHSYQYFLSAMEAGILCVPVTNPLFLIKIRMQVQTALNPKKGLSGRHVPYKSFLNAFQRIVKEEGAAALYKGVVPALFLTSHGAFKFLAYEVLKKGYQQNIQSELPIIPTLAIGAVSQVFASTVTYPYQVVKARLQQGGVRASRYRGTWDCFCKIQRNEGYRGFYKGLSANLLKVIPSGAIIFAAYEQIHKMLTKLVLES
ncbi:unnamed protein product [Albugo candida]|uniref:Mitochondrial folate transporter/carrier n=2 Tax=Albugo candida TaxID=65357 RepID=A0A024GTG6_9STRA|nr:unnamed protein product [Albugo candida]|eukprot:CCI50248.1 unnamed protein product [Albugo candida]